MNLFLTLTLLLSIPLTLVFILVLKKKNMDTWFLSYVKGLINKPKHDGPKHIMFCFVDHFEPQWGLTTGIGETRKPVTDHLSIKKERIRVDKWHNTYPVVAAKHVDADGIHPQHSFFYPEEEYRYEHLEKISDLCARGFGEIEVHMHHHDDTSENMRKVLEDFTQLLHEDHGAFTLNTDTGKFNYSFIHGNWSLCNSRKDGQYCGVNDELIVLKETGCYADFTYPSAPSDTQSPKINSIYYASDIPNLPNSHADGVDVEVNKNASGDLMIIQGPLALNFKRLKKMIFPQIENSDIRHSMPPSNDRVDLWVNTGVHVKNKPEWTFVKVHTHGTQDGDMNTLLGDDFDNMCTYLETKYNDGEKYVLHYVSAREMYNIAKAAEAGLQGNPNLYRDFILEKPLYKLMNDKVEATNNAA